MTNPPEFYTPHDLVQMCNLPIDVIWFLTHQALEGKGPFPAPSWAEMRPTGGSRALWHRDKISAIKKAADIFHEKVEKKQTLDYLGRAQAAAYHNLKPPNWDHRINKKIPCPDYSDTEKKLNLWKVETVKKYKRKKQK